ncbi:hypothetical protein MRX96_039719 [Rhipicephalus microplus]
MSKDAYDGLAQNLTEKMKRTLTPASDGVFSKNCLGMVTVKDKNDIKNLQAAQLTQLKDNGGLLYPSGFLFSREIPCSSIHSRKEPRTLNDIVNIVVAGQDVPLVVAILPPDIYAAAVTDEESGYEEGTSMDLLPGSTLRVEVVDSRSKLSDNEDEEEPPAERQKRRFQSNRRDLNSSFPVGDSCERDSTEETPLTLAEAFQNF